MIHAKVIDTLLTKEAGQNGLSQYSIATIDQQIKAVEDLIAYQDQFPFLFLPAQLSDLALAGKNTVLPEYEASWNDFLKKLEYSNHDTQGKEISPVKLQAFKLLVQSLRTFDLFPYWMSAYFLPALSKNEGTTATLNTLLAQFPPETAEFLKEVEGLRKRTSALKGRLSDFGEPEKFQKAWEDLQKLANEVMVYGSPNGRSSHCR